MDVYESVFLWMNKSHELYGMADGMPPNVTYLLATGCQNNDMFSTGRQNRTKKPSLFGVYYLFLYNGNRLKESTTHK